MAQIRVRDASGTLQTIARVRVRDAAANLRSIKRIRVRDASNILRTVYEAMTASLSPTTISGTGTTSTITTSGSCTATPDGGTAPYSYSWVAAAANQDGIAPESPTSATTAFRKTACQVGDTYIGWFTCTVTDAAGVVAVTDSVFVSIERTA